MEASAPDVTSWNGHPVADRRQQGFGVIADVYLGRGTHEPEFVLVELGGGRQTVVPLTNAAMSGGTLFVDVDAERVMAAPPTDGDPELTPQREAELYAFYGHQPPPLPPEASATTELPPDGHQAAEITRSEEQLVVDTQPQVAERVKVRKRVVTEEVTVTIPLRREELVVEREPIEVGTAEPPPDAQIVDAEFDFVLLAEHPVIEKRVVPVEQVRLHKEVVVEEEIVSDHVRKERIDVDEQPSTPPVTP